MQSSSDVTLDPRCWIRAPKVAMAVAVYDVYRGQVPDAGITLHPLAFKYHELSDKRSLSLKKSWPEFTASPLFRFPAELFHIW
jgi:hypothetical protein